MVGIITSREPIRGAMAQQMREHMAERSALHQAGVTMLMRKLDVMSTLPADWDVYGTPTPSANAIKASRLLISLISPHTKGNIDVEPSEWGGVSLRYLSENGTVVSVRLLDSGVTWYVKQASHVEFHEEQPMSKVILQKIVDTISTLS